MKSECGTTRTFEGRGSLKAADTHHFLMFQAWRIAIIQNELSLSRWFISSLLDHSPPFPETNERMHCDVSEDDKQKHIILSLKQSYTLIIRPCH